MSTRRSVYSPIQKFRRSSSSINDEDGHIMINYKVIPMYVKSFHDIRDCILPIVKPMNWIKKAKVSLQLADINAVLISKQITNLHLGAIYGLCIRGDEVIRYVSSIDLNSWNINEKELKRLAKENLVKRIGLVEKEEPLFQETQSGIFLSNKLKNLTSSLLAVPEVFNMIPFKTNSSVLLCPGPDVLYISQCHDAKGLCLIGELSLRYAQKDSALLLSTKPIRHTKGGLTLYEASIVRNESSVPSNEEQLKNYKKSLFKRSRKHSNTSS